MLSSLSDRLPEAKEICDKIAEQNNANRIDGELFCPATKKPVKSLNADLFKPPFLR